MKVTWLGHSAFIYKFSDITVIIDPFISGNPMAPIKVDDLPKIDVVLVTHSHADHFGDAKEIVKRHNATFVSSFEIAQKIGENAVGMNIGGTVKVGNLLITQVQATHSHEDGPATGFVLRHPEDSLYHAGDTGIMMDMSLIGKLYKPRIAFLPIGSHFTMGIDEAVEAVGLIQPKVVVPMHYNTFDVIKADPNEFKRKVEERYHGVRVEIFKPGEEKEI